MTVRRLHLNEAPFSPSAKAAHALQAAGSSLRLYPDDDGPLRIALSRYVGVPADHLVIGAGSNDLLFDLPILTAADPGTAVVLPEPGFQSYAQTARRHRLKVRAVGVRADGACDVAAMVDAAQQEPQPAYMVLATPHNPTGALINADDLAFVATQAPSGPLLVIDEAYYEFAKAIGAPTALEALKARAEEWLVLRTLSKAFGIAGARVGYAIASSPALAARWQALRPSFTVPGPSLAVAEAALSDLGYAQHAVTSITERRQRFADRLAAQGLAPLPSAANFLAVPAAGLGPEPANRLAEKGLVVGAFQIAGAPYLRVGIGTEADCEAVFCALAALQVSP